MKKTNILIVTTTLILIAFVSISCSTSTSTPTTTATTTSTTSTSTTTSTTTTTTISGLIAHYAFDDGSGTTATDSSSNSLDGVIYGPTWVSGRTSGYALSFDGTNDSVKIPSTSEAAPTEVASLSEGSVAVWFKFTDTGTTEIFFPLFYIGSSVEAGSVQDGAIIEIGHKGIYPDNSELFFTFTLPTSIEPIWCYDSNFDLTPEAWYHFVGVVSSTGNTGFLNGTEMTNRFYNFPDDTANDFFNTMNSGILSIGYGRSTINGLFYYFNGTIDDVQIYNRALTSAEVVTLYNQ